jgi:hypothetical protein
MTHNQEAESCPIRGLQTASPAQDHLDASEAIDEASANSQVIFLGSLFAQLIFIQWLNQEQQFEEEADQVHCPQCNIDLSGSDDSLAAHFREAKKNESKDSKWSWHSFSFGFQAPGCKTSIRIWRSRSFKFVCTCGEFSHYEKEDMERHLTSAVDTDAHIHTQAVRQPPWTRAGRD